MTAYPLPALVTRIAQGDSAAMASLYDQTSRLVYALALQAAPDPRSAEEVALEVYLRLWSTAARYDASETSVTAWLAAATSELAQHWTAQRSGRENQTMEPCPHPPPGALGEIA